MIRLQVWLSSNDYQNTNWAIFGLKYIIKIIHEINIDLSEYFSTTYRVLAFGIAKQMKNYPYMLFAASETSIMYGQILYT